MQYKVILVSNKGKQNVNKGPVYKAGLHVWFKAALFYKAIKLI